MPSTVRSTQQDLATLVRTEFRTLPPREILNRPPDVLLGVSAAALAAMTKLEINSVFDLATSVVFDDASKLVRAAEDSQTALNQHGSATSDMLREADAAGKQIGDLEYLPISALQRIPAADATSVQAAFDVDTIRDLALYPPYRAAVKILTEIYFPENAPGFDPDQPPDLLPKTGEYPTERVQYSTLLLDEIPLDDGVQIIDVASASFKPIDSSCWRKPMPASRRRRSARC